MPRPKEEYAVKSNGHIDPDPGYSAPIEIDAASISILRRGGRWTQLYIDLPLRLEQTPASKALVLRFASYALVKSAKAAIYKRSLNDHGGHFITLVVRKEPPTLYVRRGPNWKP